MNTILLIRHGATDGNEQNRLIGSTDEPLSINGIRKLREQGTIKTKPDLLYVSPMLRTRQTADILFPEVPQIIAEDLREMDFGAFEQKSPEELDQDPRFAKWYANHCLGPVPEGESTEDFKARCVAAFELLVSQAAPRQVLAFVVHGGVIMSIREAFDVEHKKFNQYTAKNGECVRCIWDRTEKSMRLEK